MTHDGAGRALHFYPLQNYILGPHEVLLMSDYSPASEQDEEARVCAINEVLERIKQLEEERRYGLWPGKYRVAFIKDEQEQGIEI